MPANPLLPTVRKLPFVHQQSKGGGNRRTSNMKLPLADQQTWLIYHVHAHEMLLPTCTGALETEVLTGASAGNTLLYLFSSSHTPTHTVSNCWLIQIRRWVCLKRNHTDNQNELLVPSRMPDIPHWRQEQELRQPTLATAAPLWWML